MLAAFETANRQNSKDESAWRRTQMELSAEPKEVRDARRQAEKSSGKKLQAGRMSMADAEALMASFAASDAKFR